MVLPNQDNAQFLDKFKEINVPNTLTLILRAKSLFDTHKEATEIMKAITDVELSIGPHSLVWCILQDDIRYELP